MLKKVILLMPLTYNDGKTVPGKLRRTFYSELYELCGGITLAGKVRGSFRVDDGGKQDDTLEQVWLAIEETKLPALRELVSRIGKTLNQEQMYFEITETRVELLPPFRDEGQS